MDRKQTTKFLSDLLINVKFSGMGKLRYNHENNSRNKEHS